VQLLDIKQVRKTGGHESLLSSHSYKFSIINNLQEYYRPLWPNLFYYCRL